MSRRFRSLALFGAMLLPAIAPAAEVLSLDDAIRHALDHNPELRASGAQAAAAEARADSTWGNLLPQVNLRYMARRSDNPLDAFADKLNTRTVTSPDLDPAAINYPGVSTVHATTLSVELPLYTGGRLTAGVQEAGRYAEAATLSHTRQQQATVYRVTAAYRAAQAANTALVIADDAVTAAREHAETTARLVRQGRIVASDRMTAELNLAAVQSAREQAASRQRLAFDRLRLVMGWPAESDISLPAWQTPAAIEAVPAVAELETRALDTRTDLKAHEAMVKVSRARVQAARSAFHPQVGVVAADSWYDDNAALDNKSQSIMGVVSMNLFSGGRDWHGLDAAQRDADEVQQRLEAARQTARAEVRAAASRLSEARNRVEIAAAGVDKAREAVRLVKQRYGEGRTILIDLLMAERVLVEARGEELTAALQQDLAATELRLADGSLVAPGAAATP